jgi:carbon storage regulator
MLVLSRKQKESIFINENIVVTVVGIRGDRVRLGIEAPREMPVHRKEVHERIQNRDGPTIGIPGPVSLTLPSLAVTP